MGKLISDKKKLEQLQNGQLYSPAQGALNDGSPHKKLSQEDKNVMEVENDPIFQAFKENGTSEHNPDLGHYLGRSYVFKIYDDET